MDEETHLRPVDSTTPAYNPYPREITTPSWPVVSFRTKRYQRAVRELDKPCESRQNQRFSPARLIAAMCCRCAPQAV